MYFMADNLHFFMSELAQMDWQYLQVLKFQFFMILKEFAQLVLGLKLEKKELEQELVFN